MQSRIENMPARKLIGNRIKMSFSNNRTFEIWRTFMPKKKEIKNLKGSDLFSIEVYPPSFFAPFKPETEFEKWAAMEVTDFDTVPEGLESVTLPAGTYAVFLYQGPASAASQTYQYILGTWLPDSGFLLDNRPHFALMGEKYKNEDPASEEELWIPVKAKSPKK